MLKIKSELGPLYKVKKNKNAHVNKKQKPHVSNKEKGIGVTIEWLPNGQRRRCKECLKIMGGVWVRLWPDKTAAHYYGQCQRKQVGNIFPSKY